MNLHNLHNRINAALGKIPCDLLIENTTYLDVFTCSWKQGDIAILDGVIVALESGLPFKRKIDGKKIKVIPGFIDAHVHIESSMMLPSSFEKAVLPHGTTSVIADPHEIANVFGIQGIQSFLKASEHTLLNLYVMLSSCVPATHLETNGGGILTCTDLLPLKNHPSSLGLAEMMNIPGLLNNDSDILSKIFAFSDSNIDGHAPLVTGQALSAVAASGISSCHESSELPEALEKLTKGIAIWIREGSVAKDLKTLIPLLNAANSPFIGFCTDDRNPFDINHEGHIDFIVKSAILAGIPDTVAFRSASWSVANHYGLNRGSRKVGAIAPGYQADLILLNFDSICEIHKVVKKGLLTNEVNMNSSSDLLFGEQNAIHAYPLEISDIDAPQGTVNVIGIIPKKLHTQHLVMGHSDEGVHLITVLERHGKKNKPVTGYVYGFGKKLNGALASSVGHDSHNLIVIGSNKQDMRVAINALIESGGGFAVASGGQVLEALDLPIAGLMSKKSPDTLSHQISLVQNAARTIGCELNDPFLQMAFLSLPVIPKLKITDLGLVDVESFKFIPVNAS